jgi:hypothetical protein
MGSPGGCPVALGPRDVKQAIQSSYLQRVGHSARSDAVSSSAVPWCAARRRTVISTDNPAPPKYGTRRKSMDHPLRPTSDPSAQAVVQHRGRSLVNLPPPRRPPHSHHGVVNDHRQRPIASDTTASWARWQGTDALVQTKIRQAWSMRRRCRRLPALMSSFARFGFHRM